MTPGEFETRMRGPTLAWFTWPLWVTVMAAILFGFFSAWSWWVAHSPADKAGQVVQATPAKEVAKAERVDVPVKAVAVYKGGAKLKKKIGLPQTVVDDPKQEVIASSRIPAGEHAHTISTAINTETGKSETYVRTEPSPLLAFENRGELGLYYGMKQGQRVTRIQIRQDFVQVKALHVGVIGSIDSDRTSFVGFGMAMRW